MWSDRESEQDFLGYTSYVNVLAETCTMKDLAPLTLGIFGAWGSGKTSLMRMLQAKVDLNAAVAKSKTLWFNAWRYEGRDEAQSALIHAVLKKVVEGKTLRQEVKERLEKLKTGAGILKLGKAIGKSLITMTPDIDGFIDCFKKESEKIAETMDDFESDFTKLLAELEVERMVVFIDDLDRCSSAKVIETFETIKLFLNTPACTFVIGADAAKIQHAVGEVYNVTDPKRQKDFLEKIVQIPFTIPEQDLRDIACYIGMLIIGRHLESKHWPQLLSARRSFYTCTGKIEDEIRGWPGKNKALLDGKLKDVEDELTAVMPYVDSLGRGLRGNPRQVKRFLNIISLRRRLAKENELDVKQDLLIKLAVLEYVWEEFFNAVVETVDPATGHSALIEEVLKAAESDDGQQSESKLVTESMGRAGLIEYLLATPKISGEIDFNPYLFLAQTSLSRGRATGLQPADEKAKSLAQAIESDDPLRSRAGAKQAAAQEPAVAASVVRVLLTDLAATKEALLRTHIINGLEAICRSHKEQYAPVVRGLSQVDPSGQDAVAISASTLFTAAEKAGATVPSELKEKFKGSEFASAFGSSARNPERAKGGPTMGTQISLPTPTGGDWTPVKHDINALLNGNGNVSPEQIIAGVIGAASGLSFPTTLGGGAGGGGGGGASGGGGGGGGGGSGGGGSGGGGTRSSSVGRVVSGLGGFASALAAGGLGAALDALGLGELRGKPAAEVVARIAEHMAAMADGLQQELLNTTLRDAILNVAALEGDRTYENLEASLQSFLARDGIEGFVESFLTCYVFDRVWTLVEQHIDVRSASENDTIAMSSAVEGGCRSQVQTLIEDLRSEGRFDGVDWFGPAGQALGDGIVATLEFRLSNPESQEGA